MLDGTTGALIPPGRAELFARRVRDLLSSPLRLEAYGIAAADRATARYSWERISRETLTAYEQLPAACGREPGRCQLRLTQPGRACGTKAGRDGATVPPGFRLPAPLPAGQGS